MLVTERDMTQHCANLLTHYNDEYVVEGSWNRLDRTSWATHWHVQHAHGHPLAYGWVSHVRFSG